MEKLSMQESLPYHTRLTDVYEMPQTHSVILGSLHHSTHTHMPLHSCQQENQTLQHSWCIPVLSFQLGRTAAGIYQITVGNAEIGRVRVDQALSLPKAPTQISPINNLFLILIS